MYVLFMYTPSQTTRQLNTCVAQTKMHEYSSCKPKMHACSLCKAWCTWQQNNVLCVHVCDVHWQLRHRSFEHTQAFLHAFSETCQVMQLLHACAVKFKLSCTVVCGMLDSPPTCHKHVSWAVILVCCTIGPGFDSPEQQFFLFLGLVLKFEILAFY